ncbi:MAG: glycosyltransferase family 9 protein [Candidatus Solibacter sp.]|nr:glycosyltransferase family 9 protein [Candidatus Solibacter sp.]
MDSVLECLPRGSRIAILRLRSLGDCVLTTPALDILKRFRPDLRLAIFVENRFREIFEGNPDLAEIHAPELAALRRFRPQLCLNLHGGTRSAWMTELSGARYRAGFGHYRQQFVYNVQIPRAQEILHVDRTVHTAEHLASAIFFLGAPICEIPGAKLVPGGAAPLTIEPKAAIIHAIAATPEKTWAAGNFLALADHLAQSGLSPVFIGAPGDDLAPFRRYRTLQTSLSEVKRLLAGAALFAGNDSGPAHMAAAFGLPCVVIFGPSDPAIWGPWRTSGEVAASTGGIADVTVTQVLSAMQRLRVPA